MCARSTHSSCAKLPEEPRRAARRPVGSRPRRKAASKKNITEEEVVCDEPLALRVGDKVVFPPHGVVVVVGMERHEIEGEAQQFFSLKSVNNGLRVMIPASRTNRPGLRAIVDEQQIAAAFKLLRKRKKVINETTWSKRQKACLARLRTGSISDIADVLRDLYLTKRDKELSIAERRLLEITHELFVTEAALATRRTEDDVDAELRVIFRLK